MKSAMLAGVLAAFSMVVPAQAQPIQAHDKDYWAAIAANDYALPADTPVSMLLPELNDYLASSDPELRDGVAYTVLTQWIYVQQAVPPDALRGLIAQWRENLAQGIGEQGTDSVFLRSFSALMLSVAAALDNKTEYLDAAEFDRLLNATLTYLREERDTRGFDAEKGWLHSVAHTADLLKFLGRNRHLEAKDQSAILTAIAVKLNGLDHALMHGEDERLARAVVSIVARPDADMAAFKAFLDSLTPVWPDGLPTPAQLAVNQNRKHLLVSLYAVLGTDPRDLASLREARAMTLELLKTTM